MYRSLKEHCSSFHLYIFAFDDKIYEILSQLELKDVSVISLLEFEDQQLLNIKNTRSKGEYCWTSTSSTILYCLTKFQLDHCTYLDADLYFFSDPQVLINELDEHHDVLITSHRYTPNYDKTAISGKYCVQFMTFKNTENGLKVLNWWRDACLNWCYGYYEEGKFGDQMYLDDWTTRFEGIHELEHLGGGMAPWNMQQYSVQRKSGYWMGHEIVTGNSFELVFFHFHAMLSFQKQQVREFYFEQYSLPPDIRKNVYMPYVSALINQYRKLKRMNVAVDGLATRDLETAWFKYAKVIRKRILNKNNKYYYWLDFS